MRVTREFDRKHRSDAAEIWYVASSRFGGRYCVGMGRTPHRAKVDLARSVRTSRSLGLER